MGGIFDTARYARAHRESKILNLKRATLGARESVIGNSAHPTNVGNMGGITQNRHGDACIRACSGSSLALLYEPNLNRLGLNTQPRSAGIGTVTGPRKPAVARNVYAVVNIVLLGQFIGEIHPHRLDSTTLSRRPGKTWGNESILPAFFLNMSCNGNGTGN